MLRFGRLFVFRRRLATTFSNLLIPIKIIYFLTYLYLKTFFNKVEPTNLFKLYRDDFTAVSLLILLSLPIVLELPALPDNLFLVAYCRVFVVGLYTIYSYLRSRFSGIRLRVLGRVCEAILLYGFISYLPTLLSTLRYIIFYYVLGSFRIITAVLIFTLLLLHFFVLSAFVLVFFINIAAAGVITVVLNTLITKLSLFIMRVFLLMLLLRKLLSKASRGYWKVRIEGRTLLSYARLRVNLFIRVRLFYTFVWPLRSLILSLILLMKSSYLALAYLISTLKLRATICYYEVRILFCYVRLTIMLFNRVKNFFSHFFNSVKVRLTIFYILAKLLLLLPLRLHVCACIVVLYLFMLLNVLLKLLPITVL